MSASSARWPASPSVSSKSSSSSRSERRELAQRPIAEQRTERRVHRSDESGDQHRLVDDESVRAATASTTSSRDAGREIIGGEVDALEHAVHEGSEVGTAAERAERQPDRRPVGRGRGGGRHVERSGFGWLEVEGVAVERFVAGAGIAQRRVDRIDRVARGRRGDRRERPAGGGPGRAPRSRPATVSTGGLIGIERLPAPMVAGRGRDLHDGELARGRRGQAGHVRGGLGIVGELHLQPRERDRLDPPASSRPNSTRARPVRSLPVDRVHQASVWCRRRVRAT